MKKNKLNQGFTLTEVVIASAILVLVLTGFLLAFTQASRLQYMADRNYAASVIARNRIEHAKIFAYSSLSTLAEDNAQVDRNGENCSTGKFWRSTLIGTSPVNTNCTKVTVKVWYETKPDVKSPTPVEVSTLIGD